MSDGFLPPSPPGEESAARQDQAGQSRKAIKRRANVVVAPGPEEHRKQLRDLAISRRRRPQQRRPPQAKIRPGSPAPTMGRGTAVSWPLISPPLKFTVWMLK